MVKHIFSTYKTFGATFLLVLFTFSIILKESYHVFWPHQSHCCEANIEQETTTSNSTSAVNTPTEDCFLCQFIITISTPDKPVLIAATRPNIVVVANSFPKNWLSHSPQITQPLRGPPSYL